MRGPPYVALLHADVDKEAGELPLYLLQQTPPADSTASMRRSYWGRRLIKTIKLHAIHFYTAFLGSFGEVCLASN